MLYQMRNINSKSRKNALDPNRRNSLQCIIRTSRQGFGNKRFGCLICGMVRIYEGGQPQDLRKALGSGPLLWSGWLLSSSTTTPHRNITTTKQINGQKAGQTDGQLGVLTDRQTKGQISRLLIRIGKNISRTAISTLLILIK